MQDLSIEGRTFLATGMFLDPGGLKIFLGRP
jgi:hypothetical protein